MPARVVYTLKILDPDGRTRPFGVPTEQFEGLDADAQRVAWRANGCVVVADVTDGPAAALGAGPCPRSEVVVEDTHEKAGRGVGVRLRCVAAPVRCAGVVKLEKRGATRFSMPAGTTRRIVLKRRVTRGYFLATVRTDDGSTALGGVTVK